MKRIIILGAQGLLGSALVEKFKKDHEVFAWDREELDITDHEATERKIREAAPQVLINAVAFNSVDLADAESGARAAAEAINAHAVQNLARVCADLGATLIHYSTDFVFSGTNTSGNTESTLPAPLNWYGVTKALGEKFVTENSQKYYLIRISRLFGHPGVSKNAKKSFVDLMIDLVEKDGKRELKLVADEVSSPTYSRDAVDFTYALLNSGAPYGIYHGANSGSCSWYEFAKHIFALKKMDVVVKPVPGSDFPRPAKRPPYSVLVNTKLPQQRPWQEALREYLLGS